MAPVSLLLERGRTRTSRSIFPTAATGSGSDRSVARIEVRFGLRRAGRGDQGSHLRTRNRKPRGIRGAHVLCGDDFRRAAWRQHERRESNPQPPVLETGALPVELRSYFRSHDSRLIRLNSRLKRTAQTTELAAWPIPAVGRYRAAADGLIHATRCRRGIVLLLARLFVRYMFPLAPTVFLELETVGASGFFLNAIVSFPARSTFEPDIFPHELAPGTRRRTLVNDDSGVRSGRFTPPCSSKRRPATNRCECGLSAPARPSDRTRRHRECQMIAISIRTSRTDPWRQDGRSPAEFV